jgi:hypothetical protein
LRESTSPGYNLYLRRSAPAPFDAGIVEPVSLFNKMQPISVGAGVAWCSGGRRELSAGAKETWSAHKDGSLVLIWKDWDGANVD